MSDFKAEMHQIQFRLGLRPRPRGGSLSLPPDYLAAIAGSYFKGEERENGREGGREGEGRQWEEKGAPHFLLTTLTTELRRI